MELHDRTIKTYSTHANTYDKHIIDFWNNFPKDFIQTFVHHLPGKKILNLGSGSGRDALLLRAHNLEVICIDASEAMVNKTRALGFESHHTTFENMSFPDETFDGVWAHGSLLHIPKAETRMLLPRLHTLLRNQGLCALGVIQGKGARLVEHETMPHAPRFFQFYTSEEIKELVSSAGFTFLYENSYDPGYDVFLNHLYQVAK